MSFSNFELAGAHTPAGGSSYTASVFDSVSASDVASVGAFAPLRSSNDALLVFDRCSPNIVFQRNCFDTVAIGDSVQRVSMVARFCIESISISDSASKIQSWSAQTFDAFLIAEDASRDPLDKIRSGHEIVLVADFGNQRTISFSRVSSDSWAANDDSRSQETGNRSGFENFSIADSDTSSWSLIRTALDALRMDDSAIREVLSFRLWGSDTLSLADQVIGKVTTKALEGATALVVVSIPYSATMSVAPISSAALLVEAEPIGT